MKIQVTIILWHSPASKQESNIRLSNIVLKFILIVTFINFNRFFSNLTFIEATSLLYICIFLLIYIFNLLAYKVNFIIRNYFSRLYNARQNIVTSKWVNFTLWDTYQLLFQYHRFMLCPFSSQCIIIFPFSLYACICCIIMSNSQ